MQDKYIGRIIHNWLGQPIKVKRKEDENYICENLVTHAEEVYTVEEIKRSWQVVNNII